MTRPGKALLIGLDSAVPGRWRGYAEAGLLPVGKRLLDEGRLAARCLPALPTLTTTNWATIATGAWPGTHGVTDFNPHRPGDVPDASPQGFDARDVKAEFIWEAAARGGRDSIVVNWPGSWPPREAPSAGSGGTGGGAGQPPHMGRVVIVGGAGIELDEWRIGLGDKDRLVALASEQRFSTEDEPGGYRVVLPQGGQPFELPFAFRDGYSRVDSRLGLVCRVVGGVQGPLARFSLPGAREALAELAAGEWSQRLTLPFQVDGSTVTGAFRLKLLALEPGAGLFRLYVSDICRLGWLEHPPGALGDTLRFRGLPTPGGGWDSLGAGLIEPETFVELSSMATTWLSDACCALMEEHSFDLFCAHFHAIDSFYHLCSGRLDVRLTPDEAERRRYQAAEVAVYRELDRALGRLIAAVAEPALVVLVSDHGATPAGPPVPLQRILRDAGLLCTRGPSPSARSTEAPGAEVIDWSKTRAVPQGSCYVRINLEGRDPEGVVAPADAARVRDEVIEAMRAYRDLEAGVNPFTLLIPGEDAAPLGLFGDGIGDVVYAVLPEFSDEHGQILPQAVREEGSWGMPALCLFSGVGAASGPDLEGDISLTDVAPTLCRALGLPRPLQCDGVERAGLLSSPVPTTGDAPHGPPGARYGVK